MHCIHDAAMMLDELERLGMTLGVTIRYERLGEESDTTSIKSGLCRVNEQYLLLVDSRLSQAERCAELARALRSFDLSNVYLTPALRRLLEDQQISTR